MVLCGRAFLYAAVLANYQFARQRNRYNLCFLKRRVRTIPLRLGQLVPATPTRAIVTKPTILPVDRCTVGLPRSVFIDVISHLWSPTWQSLTQLYSPCGARDTKFELISTSGPREVPPCRVLSSRFCRCGRYDLSCVERGLARPLSPEDESPALAVVVRSVLKFWCLGALPMKKTKLAQ